MVLDILKKLFFLFSILFIVSCEAPHFDGAGNAYYKTGDTIAWAKKNFDDSNWSFYRGQTGDSIFWARMRLEIQRNPQPFEQQGIGISAFGAYEAYWDGILIGKNGSVGREEDKTGDILRYFILPDSLAKKGEHTLALRMSQFYYGKDDRVIGAFVGNYTDLIKTPLIKTLFVHILAGAFLITALYFFIMFINDRKTFSILLFSISSFLFFLLIITEYIIFYVPIHYSRFYIRLEVISILTLLISFFIPLYFSIQFSFPKKKILIPLYLAVLLLIYTANHDHGSYDETTGFLSLSMWVTSVIIVSYAAYRKTRGAIIILLGLLLNVLVYYFLVYDSSLVVSFVILLMCMFYILSIRIKEQRKAYEYFLVQTTRLKHELLKKKIQPHFLMNTLTSLIDWVEESPKKGVQFIEALAEEFDLLNQVEDQQLIPISQEIQLCKSYLNIMKYRKEIEYIWKDEGIDDKEKIPPAIIHTLLENGITHCLPLPDGTIQFRLVFESTPEYKIYTFLTRAKIRNSSGKIIEGTGIKYIKARLTESYDSKWNFTSVAAEQGWKNTMVIYRR